MTHARVALLFEYIIVVCLIPTFTLALDCGSQPKKNCAGPNGGITVVCGTQCPQWVETVTPGRGTTPTPNTSKTSTQDTESCDEVNFGGPNGFTCSKENWIGNQPGSCTPRHPICTNEQYAQIDEAKEDIGGPSGTQSSPTEACDATCQVNKLRDQYVTHGPDGTITQKPALTLDQLNQALTQTPPEQQGLRSALQNEAQKVLNSWWSGTNITPEPGQGMTNFLQNTGTQFFPNQNGTWSLGPASNNTPSVQPNQPVTVSLEQVQAAQSGFAVPVSNTGGSRSWLTNTATAIQGWFSENVTQPLYELVNGPGAESQLMTEQEYQALQPGVSQTAQDVFGTPSDSASNANRGIADDASAALPGSQSGAVPQERQAQAFDNTVDAIRDGRIAGAQAQETLRLLQEANNAALQAERDASACGICTRIYQALGATDASKQAAILKQLQANVSRSNPALSDAVALNFSGEMVPWGLVSNPDWELVSPGIDSEGNVIATNLRTGQVDTVESLVTGNLHLRAENLRNAAQTIQQQLDAKTAEAYANTLFGDTALTRMIYDKNGMFVTDASGNRVSLADYEKTMNAQITAAGTAAHNVEAAAQLIKNGQAPQGFVETLAEDASGNPELAARQSLLVKNAGDYQTALAAQQRFAGLQNTDPTRFFDNYHQYEALNQKVSFLESNMQRLAGGGALTAQEASVARQLQGNLTPWESTREAIGNFFAGIAPASVGDLVSNPAKLITGIPYNLYSHGLNVLGATGWVDPLLSTQYQRLFQTPGEIYLSGVGNAALFGLDVLSVPALSAPVAASGRILGAEIGSLAAREGMVFAGNPTALSQSRIASLAPANDIAPLSRPTLTVIEGGRAGTSAFSSGGGAPRGLSSTGGAGAGYIGNATGGFRPTVINNPGGGGAATARLGGSAESSAPSVFGNLALQEPSLAPRTAPAISPTNRSVSPFNLVGSNDNVPLAGPVTRPPTPSLKGANDNVPFASSPPAAFVGSSPFSIGLSPSIPAALPAQPAPLFSNGASGQPAVPTSAPPPTVAASPPASPPAPVTANNPQPVTSSPVPVNNTPPSFSFPFASLISSLLPLPSPFSPVAVAPSAPAILPGQLTDPIDWERVEQERKQAFDWLIQQVANQLRQLGYPMEADRLLAAFENGNSAEWMPLLRSAQNLIATNGEVAIGGAGGVTYTSVSEGEGIPIAGEAPSLSAITPPEVMSQYPVSSLPLRPQEQEALAIVNVIRDSTLATAYFGEETASTLQDPAAAAVLADWVLQQTGLALEPFQVRTADGMVAAAGYTIVAHTAVQGRRPGDLVAVATHEGFAPLVPETNVFTFPPVEEGQSAVGRVVETVRTNVRNVLGRLAVAAGLFLTPMQSFDNALNATGFLDSSPFGISSVQATPATTLGENAPSAAVAQLPVTWTRPADDTGWVRGTASVYGYPGDRTAGARMTASGALRDNNLYSVALHSGVPLGTIVEIKRTVGGKTYQVIAVNNNRGGPLISSGQRIDLVPGTARALGGTGTGNDLFTVSYRVIATPNNYRWKGNRTDYLVGITPTQSAAVTGGSASQFAGGAVPNEPPPPRTASVEAGPLSPSRTTIERMAEAIGFADAVRALQEGIDDLIARGRVSPTLEQQILNEDLARVAKSPSALIKDFDIANHTAAEAREVQKALKARGYDVAVDGVVGPQTIRALESARVDVDRALRNIFTDEAEYQQAREIFFERFKGMPKRFEQPLLTMLRKMKEVGNPLPGNDQPIVLVDASGSREGVAIMSLTREDGLLQWQGSPELKVGIASKGAIDWEKDAIGSGKTIVGAVSKIIGGEKRGDKNWAVGALYRRSIDGGLQFDRSTWYHGVSNGAATPNQTPNPTAGCVSMCSLVMQNLYDQALATPRAGQPGWLPENRDGVVTGATKINGGYTYEFSEQVPNSVGATENRVIAEGEMIPLTSELAARASDGTRNSQARLLEATGFSEAIPLTSPTQQLTAANPPNAVLLAPADTISPLAPSGDVAVVGPKGVSAIDDKPIQTPTTILVAQDVPSSPTAPNVTSPVAVSPRLTAVSPWPLSRTAGIIGDGVLNIISPPFVYVGDWFNATKNNFVNNWNFWADAIKVAQEGAPDVSRLVIVESGLPSIPRPQSPLSLLAVGDPNVRRSRVVQESLPQGFSGAGDDALLSDAESAALFARMEEDAARAAQADVLAQEAHSLYQTHLTAADAAAGRAYELERLGGSSEDIVAARAQNTQELTHAYIAKAEEHSWRAMAYAIRNQDTAAAQELATSQANLAQAERFAPLGVLSEEGQLMRGRVESNNAQVAQTITVDTAVSEHIAAPPDPSALAANQASAPSAPSEPRVTSILADVPAPVWIASMSRNQAPTPLSAPVARSDFPSGQSMSDRLAAWQSNSMIGRLTAWQREGGGLSDGGGQPPGGGSGGGSGVGSGGASGGSNNPPSRARALRDWCARHKTICAATGFGLFVTGYNTFSDSDGGQSPDTTPSQSPPHTPPTNAEKPDAPPDDSVNRTPGSGPGAGSQGPTGPSSSGGQGGSSGFGGFLNGLLQGLLAWWSGQPQQQASAPSQPSQPSPPPPPPVKIEGAIVANPSLIDAGQTTELAWASVGTDPGPLTCAVIDPNFNVITRAGQSGTTTSPLLYESTRFGLVCNVADATGKLLNETLVRVRGDDTDPPPIFGSAVASSTTGVVAVGSGTGGGNASGAGSGAGSSSGGQSGNPAPQDIRTCDPEQPIDSFIRCLCEVEPNPAGCTIPPGGLPE